MVRQTDDVVIAMGLCKAHAAWPPICWLRCRPVASSNISMALMTEFLPNLRLMFRSVCCICSSASSHDAPLDGLSDELFCEQPGKALS